MDPRKNTEWERKQDGFEEEIVQVNRVSKKTKGGNKIGFSVLTVVGNKNGKVGVGLGKAPDVSSAIKKGVSLARKACDRDSYCKRNHTFWI
jgi:small subunit ribosomal protein S5